MDFGGLFQTGNQNAGGWRFDYNNRPTSSAALQSAGGIDPEFLKKVAALQSPEKKGLLDAALTATPLTGLLDTGGAQGRDGLGAPSAQGESFGMSPGGNTARNDSAAGYSVNNKGLAALGQSALTMNPMALAGLLGNVTQTAPVQSIVAPGLNGYNMGNYGASPTEVGAPNEAQAKTLADALAAQLAQYEQGNGSGGYGGYGGNTGGSDTMGFGGVY